ncbi:hypothetical protein JXZ92_00550 [Mycoplasma sp. CSL10137]|uniref:MMB_0454 family protein n=1 Tax=unclassified Mycoplasma TaxID=2683645 RepID=UPI00197C471C|nr:MULTISPECIES: hypothetical protein [unclassified Mycoplasma]MBN4083312.1 hypothetical protein [Mycoplasma sp. CSL10137]MBN4084385.1 hypothetical protein [Mycoplasma sp. CSL10166]MBU4692871.1 hypothetical protein [Mycoplasma sp. CSL7491-lung]MCU4706317.1 hypothetical protein [Mycoplasma sp. CSL7503-lung]
MSWINVSYHSDQVYVVQESAIIDCIKLCFLNNKLLKLINKPRISIDSKRNNCYIFLDVKVKLNSEKKVNIIIKELTKNIETSVKKLINVTPKNIQIRLLSLY